MRELAGQRAVVLGLGRTGRATAAWLAERGARVTAADERPAETLGDLGALAERVALRVGKPFPELGGFDLVVPSPGVPRARWADHAERVAGDVQLATEVLDVPFVAITGTNGKSTATHLAACMLRAAGLRAEAAGNIGRPAVELVGRPLDAAVLEVSSFQLESCPSLRPRAAVVLNVTPDHLDRHGSFEAYVEAKARLLDHQGPDDVAVLCAGDAVVAGLAPRVHGRTWWVGGRRPVSPGAFADAGHAVVHTRSVPRRIALEGWRPETGAPLETVLAALLACEALGADVEKAARALLDFTPLPHRREAVAERDGVLWIDDSKATNPAAAAHALAALSRPAVWLAGGRGKGLAFDGLADAARGRVRTALLFGESAPELARALSGAIPVERVSTLDAAVARAAELARPGDVVLLSPACASFDQFSSFEERGDRFRVAVEALSARPGARP